jgi:hypothetical protein
VRPLFEIESAKSKRPADDDDSFAFEPMNANVRAGEIRRNPSTDEKKARRKHVAAKAPFDCSVCDRTFETAEQANTHELGNPKHRVRKAAGIMDWYDVVVLWSGDEVGMAEAGYADQRDAVTKAEEIRNDPKALRVHIINRNDGSVIWSNGEFAADVVASKTARMSYFDIEVQYDDSQYARVEAGTPSYADALIIADRLTTTPHAEHVLIVNREGGEVMWRDGKETIMAGVLRFGSTPAMRWNDLRTQSFEPGEEAWGLTYDSDNLHGEAHVNGGGSIFPGEFRWYADAKARQG